MQLVIQRAVRKILLGAKAETHKEHLGGLVIPDIEKCELIDFNTHLIIKGNDGKQFWEIATSGDWVADRLLMLIMDGISRAEPKYTALFIRQKRLGDSGTELVAAFTSA